jgi:2-oxo-4-hydroxy-4-carboxy-5-ureidoimidazoline decarboxylase
LSSPVDPACNLQLDCLNALSPTEAEAEFLKCCGSNSWAQRMVAKRPFGSLNQLIKDSDRIWWSLKPTDWLEAFHSHPKIGEKKAAAAIAAEAQQWAEDEQSGTRAATAETIAELAELNSAYEKKFGYIFIVCASGKSSEEMLGILRGRLQNKADDELRIAAAEQAKITQLRIRKLVAA